MNISITYSGGQLLVKEGQKVDFKTPYLTLATGEDIKMPLAKDLGIDPKKIFNFVKKFVGDEVKKGELLAEKKTLLSTKKFFSEYEGVIKEINHEEGTVILNATALSQKKVSSPFAGEVVQIEKNQITLSVKDYKKFELKKASGNFGGFVHIVSDEELSSLTEEKIENRIVFNEKITEFEQTKIEALGAEGFVTVTQPPRESQTHFALAKEADWEKMTKTDYPYCIIDSGSSTIYLYTS